MAETHTEALETELRAFERELPGLLLHHRGKYALFHGGEFTEVFDSEAAAYEEGVRRFGDDTFLVRLVTDPEEVQASLPGLYFVGLIGATP